MRHSFLSLILILSGFLVTTLSNSESVHAQGLRLVGQTDFPLFIGAGVDIELPGRLRLSSAIGYLPTTYVRATNAALVPLFEKDGYTRELADLVESTIQHSLLWRSSIGIRPFEQSGFIIAGGYTMGGLGGDASAPQVVSAATGVSFPSLSIGSGAKVHTSAMLNILHVELGWTWNLGDALWLKTALGAGYTFWAVSSVESVASTSLFGYSAFDSFDRKVEKELDDAIMTYVHPPHLSVALGLNF